MTNLHTNKYKMKSGIFCTFSSCFVYIINKYNNIEHMHHSQKYVIKYNIISKLGMQLLKLIRVTCKREVKLPQMISHQLRELPVCQILLYYDENSEFIKSPTMHDQFSHLFRHLIVEGISSAGMKHLHMLVNTHTHTHTHTHTTCIHTVCVTSLIILSHSLHCSLEGEYIS